MSRREPEVRLQVMLDHAREAVELASRTTQQDLHNNRVLALALMHLVESVPQVASQITLDMRQEWSQIPWRAIWRMAGRIDDGYGLRTVDAKMLWATIRDDLPPLIAQLEAALPPSEPQ